MKSSTDLRKLITQAQTSGIASEDDARLKFINGLLDWLGLDIPVR